VLDHYARGAFAGLSMGHTKAHLARAVMEGVAFHIRWIIEAMEAIGLGIKGANAIGGGSTSPVWTQIISDITGQELRVVEHPLEAGAIGAALTVAVGMGVYPDMEAIDGLIPIARVVRPGSEEARRRYDALYREYRALYEALAPIFRRLHEVNGKP
jgi:xylulokinase